MAGRTTKKRRAKKRGHRPTKYTPEAVEKICAAIVTGDTIEEACKRVGISRQTFYEWHQRADIADKVHQAKTARLIVLEERWAKASEKDWRAAEAMLRVLKPKQFAQRISVHVESELAAVIARFKERYADDPEQLERALATLAGEPGEARAPEAPASADDGNAGSGEAVHPPRTV